MNKITLVTEPDDILVDAFRILCVNLTVDQTQFLSDIVNDMEYIVDTVVYVWNDGDDEKWLFDKKTKSNLIVFNASTECGEINGYLAAQPNSFYFGPLRNLSLVNIRDIYDATDFKDTLLEYIRKYEQIYE
jgi:hypothetical protein